jgi:TolB-like protein/Tfp pilus assembly protein PilF
MKRCPTCNRLESDSSLGYCRVDGSPLSEASSEIETSLLPQTVTDSGRVRSTGPTTVLPAADVQSSTGQLKSDDSSRKHVASTRSSLIAGAIGIVIVTVLGVGSYWMYGRSGKQISSIAVMPFVNESGNADAEYLSDGMTETLIASLSQLPNLNVKARSSVFRYKGKATDAKSIGKELNVQAVLNGRVMQRGDQLTLSLELVNAETENVIWSEQYNRKQADLVSLQTEIARDVSSKLKTKLSGADAAKLEKTYTTNSEAYKLYLQGRFYWNKREEKEFRKAVEYYDQAIALDRSYALAYAGLADTYALLATFGFMPTAEGIPKARGFAREALRLDDTLAEPHTTIAYLSLTYDYNFTAGEREFRRAIELNPNYATAHQWYAELLTNSGRFDEAEAEFRRGLEIEPLSIPINWDYGRFLYNSRRFDESVAQHQKTIELNPSFARAHRTLSEVFRMKGDYAKVIDERAKFFELIGQPQSAALIRDTFSKDGWTGYLRLITSDESALKEGNNNWVMAKAYLDLGEKDKALDELDKAYEKRLSSLCWLKIEPQMDPLRSEPRYQELLAKMNFPQ